MLEPLERGAGLIFCRRLQRGCSGPKLAETDPYPSGGETPSGVLTGSEITDMKITLIAGRAHLKHTEGGDFRQATYRAVRQGLRKAESILLEPVYEYSLEVPQDTVGRGYGRYPADERNFFHSGYSGAYAFLTGTAPVSEMRDYQREVTAYTRGRGASVLCIERL